jgi:hypothetical protein
LRICRTSPLYSNVIAISTTARSGDIARPVVVQLVDIIVSEEVPPIFLDVIEVTRIAGERIAMASRINASPAQLLRFLVRQIPPIALVEDTVCEGASRTD